MSKQVNVHVQNNIPATFVVRYDALKDPKYMDFLKSEIKQHPGIIRVGALLEIVPSLAKESEVSYRGRQEGWYEAQNLFSIGYSEEENMRIADRLFETFYQNFGYYPSITSSWMIKSTLLNYLNDKYGVKIHQITREQWGTDSYSLYGGPPHYPYPASSSWLFMPDYFHENSPLIVRQTVTDPLYNYGDNTSSFTSQPNDYLRNKEFNYFEKLFKQAVSEQTQTGFALIGLENSMDERFQNEYVKQIKLIKKYKDKDLVSFPDEDGLRTFWSNKKITLYEGKDLVKSGNNQAFWITTPLYRIRLRQNNNKVFISDIRIYDPKFSDPYENQPARKEGFWIAPFLLDGSLKTKSEDFSFFKQPSTVNKFIEVSGDIGSNPIGIELPDIKYGKEIKRDFGKDELKFSYEAKDGRNIEPVFLKNSIKFSGIESQELVYKNNFPPYYPVEYKSYGDGFSLSWNVKNEEWINLKVKCRDKTCSWVLDNNEQLANAARKEHYEYLLPEPAGHLINETKTVLYPNNQYAVAARNPVRLILIPYDKYGIISDLKDKCKDISANFPMQCIQDGKRYFLDFYVNQATSKQIKVSLGGNVSKNIKAYFAPNCKLKIKECILSPKYAWWYLNSIIGDKIRQTIFKEKL